MKYILARSLADPPTWPPSEDLRGVDCQWFVDNVPDGKKRWPYPCPPRKSWNILLQEMAASVPEAVYMTKRLVPTIERVAPHVETVSDAVPYLTIGLFALAGAIVLYTVKR